MKKKAKDLKKEDKIKMGEKTLTVSEIEISDIGKHGKSKVRIVAKRESGESMVVIRPEDYPFEII